MAETIVSDKKNRSVPNEHERERVCMCLRNRKRKSAFDVTIAALIIYLIDQLSPVFLYALFSVNQLLRISIRSYSFLDRYEISQVFT